VWQKGPEGVTEVQASHCPQFPFSAHIEHTRSFVATGSPSCWQDPGCLSVAQLVYMRKGLQSLFCFTICSPQDMGAGRIRLGTGALATDVVPPASV
jgi:hypothetical protein